MGEKKTAEDIKAWYEKNKALIERFKKAQEAFRLIDTNKNYTKSTSTFSKETLRTYMKNPLTQYKNLRNLSRYLYYRSQIYRRIVQYNASMIDLNYRSVIPLINLTKEPDKKTILKSYYNTLSILEKMNLPLEFLKVYITCWREDVFFGCAYYDDTGFFILPLDPDYCKIVGVYPTGDFAFNMDMSYFSKHTELIDLWGSPFTEMWNKYQTDTLNEKWQPMPDENCVCLKINVDDWQIPIPPYASVFDSIINLEDLKDIMAVADEQQIYKLLYIKMPLLNNGESDAWAVDPDTVIKYYNQMCKDLPDYTNACILPGMDLDSVEFNNNDQAADVDKIEKSTKSILSTMGGAIPISPGYTGSTYFNLSMKADEDYSISSLLPQTEAWINRFLSYKISKPAKVRFLEVTKYTKQEYLDQELKKVQYGFPNRLMINTLSGISELETLSLSTLEDILDLDSKFIPPATSNTTNGSDLINKKDSGGQEKSDAEITDDGEASRDKKENAN